MTVTDLAPISSLLMMAGMTSIQALRLSGLRPAGKTA